MKLTNPEKLILVMLAELHDKLGIKETNTKLIQQAIHTDNTWALSWEMPGIVAGEPDPTPPEVSLVVDILDMWSFIEEAYEDFDAAQKSDLEAKAPIFGKGVEFIGFDGNNEADARSIALFLVNDMDRFTRFSDRDLNSHHHVIDSYQRMLAVFEPIRVNVVGRRLSVDELAQILNARAAGI